MCVLQEWCLFLPQSCGAAVIRTHWPSKPNALGAILLTPDPQAGEPDVELRILTPMSELLQLFSSLWVAHPVIMGFDYIMSVPLLPSCCDFFFVFGCRISFLVSSSLFYCYSAVSCDFGVLMGGGEHKVFYSAIWSSLLWSQYSFVRTLVSIMAQHTK